MDLAYNEYVDYYKAFCKHTGKRLPTYSLFSAGWTTKIGPWPVDLKELHIITLNHRCVDSNSSLLTWADVSQRISQGQEPAAAMQQLYCTHFDGFEQYVAARTKENRAPPSGNNCHKQQQTSTVLSSHQQQQQQQRIQTLGWNRQEKLLPAAPAAAKGSSSSGPTHKPTSPPGAAAGTGRGAAAAAGVRRSGRTRTQAVHTGYINSNVIPSDSSDGDSSDASSDSEGPDDGGPDEPMCLGPEHQAELPQLRSEPVSGPTSAEAKFLSRPICMPTVSQQQQQQQQPGVFGAAPCSDGLRHGSACPNPGLALGPGVFRSMWHTAGAGAARQDLLANWLLIMDQHMGVHLAQSLGLSLLGSKLAAVWHPAEEVLFALGMLDKYRMFRHMRRRYLPRRSVHELNGYYYNVWKTRGGQVAEEYAHLCECMGDPFQFREQLCVRLAAMWDSATMGPLPPAAALPPGNAPAHAAAGNETAAAAAAVHAAAAGNGRAGKAGNKTAAAAAAVHAAAAGNGRAGKAGNSSGSGNSSSMARAADVAAFRVVGAAAVRGSTGKLFAATIPAVAASGHACAGSAERSSCRGAPARADSSPEGDQAKDAAADERAAAGARIAAGQATPAALFKVKAAGAITRCIGQSSGNKGVSAAPSAAASSAAAAGSCDCMHAAPQDLPGASLGGQQVNRHSCWQQQHSQEAAAAALLQVRLQQSPAAAPPRQQGQLHGWQQGERQQEERQRQQQPGEQQQTKQQQQQQSPSSQLPGSREGSQAQHGSPQGQPGSGGAHWPCISLLDSSDDESDDDESDEQPQPQQQQHAGQKRKCSNDSSEAAAAGRRKGASKVLHNDGYDDDDVICISD